MQSLTYITFIVSEKIATFLSSTIGCTYIFYASQKTNKKRGWGGSRGSGGETTLCMCSYICRSYEDCEPLHDIYLYNACRKLLTVFMQNKNCLSAVSRQGPLIICTILLQPITVLAKRANTQTDHTEVQN